MAWFSLLTAVARSALTAINDTYQKLFKLSKYCGVGVSGASELAAKFVDEFQVKLQGKGE